MGRRCITKKGNYILKFNLPTCLKHDFKIYENKYTETDPLNPPPECDYL